MFGLRYFRVFVVQFGFSRRYLTFLFRGRVVVYDVFIVENVVGRLSALSLML